jgi:cytoskeletal protein RodZ
VTNPQVGHALDCTRARELIDAFLLDELDAPDAARLALHVKGCAACTVEIGSSTRVLGLLGSLDVPHATVDLDQRILVAAFDERTRRRSQRSWLSDLRSQVIRGAMRTTGTLIVTVLSVALLGGAFVFAASQVVLQLPPFVPRDTLPPVSTPTISVPAVQTAEPTTTATPRPSSVVSASPEVVISPTPSAPPPSSAAPTVSPTPEPSASPTPEPTAEPTPTPTPSSTAEPSPSASPEPTPTPEPSASPTDKPKRTPPPSVAPSPLP